MGRENTISDLRKWERLSVMFKNTAWKRSASLRQRHMMIQWTFLCEDERWEPENEAKKDVIKIYF